MSTPAYTFYIVSREHEAFTTHETGGVHLAQELNKSPHPIGTPLKNDPDEPGTSAGIAQAMTF